MTEALFPTAFAALMLAVLLGLVRIARGPTVMDRILAFDMVAAAAMGGTVLLSALWRTPDYIELILMFSLLGFFGTVVFAAHLSKSSVRPRKDSAPEAPGSEREP